MPCAHGGGLGHPSPLGSSRGVRAAPRLLRSGSLVRPRAALGEHGYLRSAQDGASGARHVARRAE